MNRSALFPAMRLTAVFSALAVVCTVSIASAQPGNSNLIPAWPGLDPSNGPSLIPGYDPSNPSNDPSLPGYISPNDPSNGPSLIPGYDPSNPSNDPSLPGYINPGPPIDPDNPDDNPQFEKTSCCIPETYGSVCVQGLTEEGAPRNESECLYNQLYPDTSVPILGPHTDIMDGIYVDPQDGVYYPGRVFDTSQAQCSNFCGERFTYWYCINRPTREEGAPISEYTRAPGESAKCIPSDERAVGANNPYGIQEGEYIVNDDIKRVERGYLYGGPADGFDTCIQACPPDTCESCDVLTHLMDNVLELEDFDEDGRKQFCGQASHSCVAEYDNRGRIVCMQRPLCNTKYLAMCDLGNFEYVMTNTNTDEESEPPEMSRYLSDMLFEPGAGASTTPNPDYVPNLRWIPPARGGLDFIDNLLTSLGLVDADGAPNRPYAAIDLDARDRVIGPDANVVVTDPETNQPMTDYVVRIEANQCLPRYAICCDGVGWMEEGDEDLDGDGEMDLVPTGPMFLIAEEHNAPITPELQEIVDRYNPNALYVNYVDRDENGADYVDDDSKNDIQGCMGESGQENQSWVQWPRGKLEEWQLGHIDGRAFACRTDIPPPIDDPDVRDCLNCGLKVTENTCVPPNAATPWFCRWIQDANGGSCVMNDWPVDQGGHEACLRIPKICRDCRFFDDMEVDCRGQMGVCEWMATAGAAPGGRMPTLSGRCIPNPNDPLCRVPSRQYLACDRTVDRRSKRTDPPMAEQCFGYNPDARAIPVPYSNNYVIDPATGQPAFDAEGNLITELLTRADLLKTHVITFDNSSQGTAMCHRNCEDIKLFGYCCDRPSGEVFFEDINFCRSNRNVTWGVRDDGSIDEDPIGDAARDCEALAANFRATPPPAQGGL